MRRVLTIAFLSLSLLAPPASALAPKAPASRGEVGISGTVYFGGYVVGVKAEPLANATVLVNGLAVSTDEKGYYELEVPLSEDGLYKLTVTAFGKVPVEELHSEGHPQGLYALRDAALWLIDPKEKNTLVDEQSGLSVTLPAGGLVDEQGAPPEGPVQVSLSYFQPSQMPGDLTALNLDSEETWLDSVGAFNVEVQDEKGRRFDLAPGAIASAYLPVPGELNGSMPKCVLDSSCRMSMYRFEEGRWVEKKVDMSFDERGTSFQMVGGEPALAASGGVGAAIIRGSVGLGMWNADIEKRNPACTIIRLLGYPPTCFSPYGNPAEPGVTLTRTLPGAGGTPITRSGRVTSQMSYVVLYNIPANVLGTYSIAFPEGASPLCTERTLLSSSPDPAPGYPSGLTTRVDTGAPWGGTGFPKWNGTPINSASIAEGNHPCKSVVTYLFQW